MKIKKELRREQKDLLSLARWLDMSPDHVLNWLLRLPVGARRKYGDLEIWRRTYSVVHVWDLDADKCVYQGPLTQLLKGAEA